MIRAMVDDPDGADVDKSLKEKVVASYRQILSGVKEKEGVEKDAEERPAEEAASPGEPPPPEDEGQIVTCRIRFSPAPGIFLCGTNPVLLLNELRELGDCMVLAQVDQIPGLEDINPESARPGKASKEVIEI